MASNADNFRYSKTPGALRLPASFKPTQYPVLTTTLTHKRRFDILRPAKSKFLSQKISGQNGQFELSEPKIPYSPLFALEKCSLSSENSCFWDILRKYSMR
jgi:hypothetical protein